MTLYFTVFGFAFIEQWENMRTERKVQFVPESTHCKLELIILSSFFTEPSAAVHPPHLLSAAPRLHFNITLPGQRPVSSSKHRQL